MSTATCYCENCASLVSSVVADNRVLIYDEGCIVLCVDECTFFCGVESRVDWIKISISPTNRYVNRSTFCRCRVIFKNCICKRCLTCSRPVVTTTTFRKVGGFIVAENWIGFGEEGIACVCEGALVIRDGKSIRDEMHSGCCVKHVYKHLTVTVLYRRVFKFYISVSQILVDFAVILFPSSMYTTRAFAAYHAIECQIGQCKRSNQVTNV